MTSRSARHVSWHGQLDELGEGGTRQRQRARAELGAERLGLLLADRHGKIGGFGEDARVNEDTLVTPGQVVRSSRR